MNSNRLPRFVFWALLFTVVLIFTLTSGLLKWNSQNSVPQIPGQKNATKNRTDFDFKNRKIQVGKFEDLKKKFDKLSPWIPPTVAGKYHYYVGTTDEYYIIDLPDISDIVEGEERFFVYWKTGSPNNLNGTVRRIGKRLFFSDLGEGYLIVEGGTLYLVFEDKILRKQPKKQQ